MEHIIKKQVAEFRLTNNLKKYSPVNTYDLLEKLKILTVFLPCANTISGMAIKAGNHRFMMINSNLPLGRQHFTICHEIAAFLMMPEDTIYAEIPEVEFEQKCISDKTIFKLEQKLQCSHQALLFRLHNLKIITKEQYQKEKEEKGIAKKAKRLGFDDFLYKPGNANKVIGDYENLAKKIYDLDKISESHYISFLQDIFKEI